VGNRPKREQNEEFLKNSVFKIFVENVENFQFSMRFMPFAAIFIFLKFRQFLKISIFSKIFEKSKNVGNRPKRAQN
jgi:uncharacterized membrane protein YfbV (UPF0208 family)